MSAISPIAAAPITGTPGAVVNVTWGLSAGAGNSASAAQHSPASAGMAANDNIGANSAHQTQTPATVLALVSSMGDSALEVEVSAALAMGARPALAGSLAPVIGASSAMAATAGASASALSIGAPAGTLGARASFIAVGMATASGQALVAAGAFSGQGLSVASGSAPLGSALADMGASAIGNGAPIGTLTASGAMTVGALADRTVAWSITAGALTVATRAGTAIADPVLMAAAPGVAAASAQTLHSAASAAASAAVAGAQSGGTASTSNTFAARPNITALAAQFNSSAAMFAAGAVGGSAIADQAPAGELIAGAGMASFVGITDASRSWSLEAAAGFVAMVASVRTPAGIDLTDSEIMATLRSFLMEVFPFTMEIIQGQSNRVPEPIGPSFVVMTAIGRKRLATNVDTLTTFGHRGTKQAKASFQYDIQLDVYGPDAADNAQILATLLRDEYATRYFDAQPNAVQSLYAGDAKQAVFTNAEAQYENRWTIDVSLQANPVVSTSLDYADTLQIDGLINVDVVYPPEP